MFEVYIFWLFPVWAAHGTPFYSQYARLNVYTANAKVQNCIDEIREILSNDLLSLETIIPAIIMVCPLAWMDLWWWNSDEKSAKVIVQPELSPFSTALLRAKDALVSLSTACGGKINILLYNYTTCIWIANFRYIEVNNKLVTETVSTVGFPQTSYFRAKCPPP